MGTFIKKKLINGYNFIRLFVKKHIFQIPIGLDFFFSNFNIRVLLLFFQKELVFIINKKKVGSSQIGHSNRKRVYITEYEGTPKGGQNPPNKPPKEKTLLKQITK